MDAMNRRDCWITVSLLLVGVALLAAPAVGIHNVGLPALIVFAVAGVRIVGAVLDFVNERWRQ